MLPKSETQRPAPARGSIVWLRQDGSQGTRRGRGLRSLAEALAVSREAPVVEWWEVGSRVAWDYACSLSTHVY